MKINLIDVLKSLPTHNYKNDGLAISFGDIFNALESLGFDNKNLIEYELRKLSDAGIIDLLSDENFDKDLFYAVRFK